MLPSSSRLKLKTDFENVRQNGKFVTGHDLSISFFDRKDTNPSRFGIVVSKKISTKSHDRNRIKRVIRELIHKKLNDIKPGYDYIIIVKSGIINLSSVTIEKQYDELFAKTV